ncbi:hypothetical protein SOVF_075670, partial [Spinacia oleracea]
MGRRSSSRPPFHKRGGSPAAGRVPFPRGQSIFSSSSSPTFEEGVEPNLGGASIGDTSRGGESGQESNDSSGSRKRKWASNVWDHYNCFDGGEFNDKRPRAYCKYCNQGPVFADSHN